MRTIEFSDEADVDLVEIARYTSENFGETQALKYARELYQGMENICQFPKIGKERSDVITDIRSFPVQYHIVYYFITERTIEVVRVLNQSQDPFVHIAS